MARKSLNLTQTRAKEIFDYNEETGELFRKPYGSRWGKTVASQEGKSLTVKVDDINWKAHRLIWLMMTGHNPKRAIVRHRNGNLSDNRWSNLYIPGKAAERYS